MNAHLHPDRTAASALVAQEPLDLASLVGGASWVTLSPAIRRRFAAAHANVVYLGAMDLDCSSVGRCFAVLARLFGGPLLAVRRDSVPAQVHVCGNDQGGVIWERHLGLAGRLGEGEQVVRSTKLLGPQGCLEERTDGGLSMSLEVVTENGALVFYSRHYFIALGPLRLRVPSLLTPGVCRVEHRDEGPGQFRFTLDMVHPWWGRTFHQTGLFTDPDVSPE
jgi:hypothetical protein